MKKIGLVLHSSIAYSETFFDTQINALKKSGAEIIVFVKYQSYLPHSSHKYVRGLPLFLPRLNQLFYFFFVLLRLCGKGFVQAFRLFKLERKAGCSITDACKSILINAHILSFKLDYLHFGFATTALKREFVAKAIGARMTVSGWGYDIGVYPLLYPKIYYKLWALVDKFHFGSHELSEKAIHTGLKREEAFYVIHHAIDCEKFLFKAEPGKFHRNLKITSIGRLHWKKGHEYSLMAIKMLIENGIALHLTIIGEGESRDEVLYTIHDLGLTPYVTLTGSLSHKETISILSNSDIYLQSSVQEGFGVAVLEAQAAGLMVVACDAEGIKENIDHGKSGWIVPKRNPEAIAKQIVKIIEMPIQARKEIAVYSRKRVEEKFNLELYEQQWAYFFEMSS